MASDFEYLGRANNEELFREKANGVTYQMPYAYPEAPVELLDGDRVAFVENGLRLIWSLREQRRVAE